jgi:hypothetical protein
MKSRKLELENLEDQKVPSSFTGYAAQAKLMTNPVIGVVATPEPAPIPSVTAIVKQPLSLKLAVNHNETLVRDRTRVRKRRSERGGFSSGSRRLARTLLG